MGRADRSYEGLLLFSATSCRRPAKPERNAWTKEDDSVTGRNRISVIAGLFFAAMCSQAGAAAPQPWQWTPAKAAAELVAENPPIPWGNGADVKTNLIYRAKLSAPLCQPRGTRYGNLYAAFQCSVTWKASALSHPPQTVTLFVKVRKVAQPTVCVSLTSLAAIPAGCLAPGSRSLGERDGRASDAKNAVTKQEGYKPILDCWGFGSGYFECATPDQRYAVTLGVTSAIVKQL